MLQAISVTPIKVGRVISPGVRAHDDGSNDLGGTGRRAADGCCTAQFLSAQSQIGEDLALIYKVVSIILHGGTGL